MQPFRNYPNKRLRGKGVTEEYMLLYHRGMRFAIHQIEYHHTHPECFKFHVTYFPYNKQFFWKTAYGFHSAALEHYFATSASKWHIFGCKPTPSSLKSASPCISNILFICKNGNEVSQHSHLNIVGAGSVHACKEPINASITVYLT